MNEVIQPEKRWVYGTKTDQWYLVDSRDRDFIHGLQTREFAKLTKEQAKQKYLQTHKKI